MVELLIVIVVIAILAAISVVAYNGIQQRARTAAASSALNTWVKQLELYKVEHGTYPADASQASLDGTSNVTYEYTSDTSAYCITATSSQVSLFASNQSPKPQPGGCVGHSQGGVAPIKNLVANPTFEVQLSGWSAPGNQRPTLTRVSTEAHSGTYATRVFNNRSGLNTDPNQQRFYITVNNLTVGENYVASAHVKPASGQRFRIGPSAWASAASMASTSANEWQRIHYSFQASASSHQVVLTTIQPNSSSGLSSAVHDYVAEPFVGYVDSLMVTEGELTPYRDGTSQGWSWLGQAHSSVSVGMP